MEVQEIIELLRIHVREINGDLYVERDAVEDVLIDCNLSVNHFEKIINALEALQVNVVDGIAQMEALLIIDEELLLLEEIAINFINLLDQLKDNKFSSSQLDKLTDIKERLFDNLNSVSSQTTNYDKYSNAGKTSIKTVIT